MKNLSIENINVHTLKEEVKQEVSQRRRAGGFDLVRSPHWVSVKSLVLIHTIEASLQPTEVLPRGFKNFLHQLSKRVPLRVSTASKRIILKLNQVFSFHGNGNVNHSLIRLTKLSLENQKLLLALINEINISNANRLLELEFRVKALETISQSSEDVTSDD